MGQINTSAPGRICLFGDHQDYLDLPIIACAIDRYIRISGAPNNSDVLNIHKPDLDTTEKIGIQEDLSGTKDEDYLRLALKVLRKYGCIPDKGYDVEITGNIPVSAGLSSSSALTIAWMRFLIKAYGISEETDPMTLARLAYESEVMEQSSSGGKMDQFTISLGGTIYLDTRTDQVESLQSPLSNMVIGVSGDPKDTLYMLAKLKTGALDAIEEVRKHFPDYQIDKDEDSDFEKYTRVVSEDLKPIFEAAVRNYRITRKAREAFMNGERGALIGDLMNQHHAELRDQLKITTPRIDAMINNALRAGAWGAKIVGSGGGGCIAAICPDESLEAVIKSIKAAGAVDSFSVQESPGAGII